jgi:pimeloyl-ACP methyl ester carboxylesterase
VTERVEISLPDGRTLEAVDEGDPEGMLVVLHHGSPGSAEPFPTFDRAARERGIRLVEYSRAGYGGSSRKEGRRVADAAADTAALAGSP